MKTKIRAGFPHQRIITLSADVIARCNSLPYVKECYVTDIKCFPLAKNHFINCLSGSAEFLLIYCVGGSGLCQLGKQMWNIREGNMLIVPAGIPYYFAAHEQSPWTIYWVQIKGETVAQYIASLGVTESQPVLEVKEVVRITDCFERMLQDLQQPHILQVYSDETLLLLSAAQIHIFAILLASKKFSETQERYIEPRIFRSIHYMKANIDRPLTLACLAANVNMSNSHYSALFKQQTNNSPIAFFNNLKIQYACELFNSGKSNIALVATDVGFEDTFYFSRIFKKIVGVTPSKYIKRST